MSVHLGYQKQYSLKQSFRSKKMSLLTSNIIDKKHSLTSEVLSHVDLSRGQQLQMLFFGIEAADLY